MDQFINSVPAVVWLLVIGASAATIMYVWHKERASLENKSVDALRAMGEDVASAIDKLVAAESADVARRVANLQDLQKKAVAARQAISAKVSPPSV